MKLIQTIRDFRWAQAWLATQIFLMALGGVALAAWFANPLRPLALAASLLFVVLLWWTIFRLVCAIRLRRYYGGKNRAASAHGEPSPEDQSRVPARAWDPEHDVELALINQGYTRQQAREAIAAAPASARCGFESLFRAALGGLAN
jgi:hypothetical protein